MILSYSKKIIKLFLITLGLKKKREQVRKDVEIISIQPGLELVVYWKVLKIGKGPAVILRADGNEILKFDCFGKNEGHFHVIPNYGSRIHFEEESALDQIERTAQELNMKSQTYLHKLEGNKFQKIIIDQDKLEAAVDLARQKMIFFLKTVPELEDI